MIVTHKVAFDERRYCTVEKSFALFLTETSYFPHILVNRVRCGPDYDERR